MIYNAAIRNYFALVNRNSLGAFVDSAATTTLQTTTTTTGVATG